MPKPRKYIVGDLITDTTEALREILAGRYIFCNHKPTHPSWALSWRVHTLHCFVQGGSIRKADINPEWRPKPFNQED